jgi:hypothetical protein
VELVVVMDERSGDRPAAAAAEVAATAASRGERRLRPTSSRIREYTSSLEIFGGNQLIDLF